MSLDDVKKLRAQFLEVLDGAIANLENGVEIENSTNFSKDTKKRVAKRRKSIYNEFETLAMQWAHNNNTNVGDATILNRKGKEFVLLEATDNGYIEIASGKYDYVRKINEQVYGKPTISNRLYFEEYRAEKGSDRWNTINVGDRGNGRRIDNESGEERLQNNPSGNNESVRSNSEETSEQVKLSLDVDTDGNKLTTEQQEYFADSKIRDESGRLLVVYHGTPNEFTIFDNKSVGHYFTDNKKYADGYS